MVFKWLTLPAPFRHFVAARGFHRTLGTGKSLSFVTVKAPRGSDVPIPADQQHRLKIGWARPQVVSGESDGSARCWYARRGPFADGLELLDLARRVLLRADGRVVDGLIAVGLAARQQDVDQPDHSVQL